jgi:hypothetical protein
MFNMPSRIAAQVQSAPLPSNTVTTFRQRGQWARAVARNADVKLSHRNVLRSLADLARLDKAGKLVIDPTYDALAAACVCHRATAIRAIAFGVEIGIVGKVRSSDGRVSNTFELLFPEFGSNGCKFEIPTVANIDDVQGSNGCYTGNRLKVKRTVEVVSKISKRQGRVLTDRDSANVTAVTSDMATSEVVVQNATVELTISPAFASVNVGGIDQGRASTVLIPDVAETALNPDRESAGAARSAFTELLRSPWNNPDVAALNPRDLHLNAASENLGRGNFANGGLVIDEDGNEVDEIAIAPQAREPMSCLEMVLGVGA